MKNYTKNNQEGSALIVVLVIIMLAAAAFLVLEKDKLSSVFKNNLLPSVSQRTNPEPTGTNRISLAKVVPGTSVTVDDATLAQTGYLVVLKDTKQGKVSVGKSTQLLAGVHDKVVVPTSSLVDGDVIYVQIQTVDGKQVKDVNNNLIEVQRNVGVVMTHYANEY